MGLRVVERPVVWHAKKKKDLSKNAQSGRTSVDENSNCKLEFKDKQVVVFAR